MRVIGALLLLLVTVTAQAATYSGSLPVLFIDTDGGAPVNSKEVYVDASYYLDPMGVEGVEAIGTKSEALRMQIRGRGNYSWAGFDKKPYRIKLADKQPLLGLNKSKHFALLAHADDTYGFMRNIVGFQLSRMIGLAWTPADEPVEVVLNGDYIGLYFLTETIRVDKDRVNIVEQPDNATEPDIISGGWLVEIDNYDSDPHIEIYEKDKDNNRIVFTYKTPEVLSPQQTAYLTEQMTAINDAIYNPDINDNSWEDWVDVETLARYYIVQEIVDDYESFHGSCYMYKNQGNCKWMFGPVWDFGNAFAYDKSQFIFQGRQWHNTWIGPIYKHPHFVEIVSRIWTEFERGQLDDIYGYIDAYAARIKVAARSNAERWPLYGNADIDERVAVVKDRLDKSIKWLNGQWLQKETFRTYFIDNNTTKPWEQVYAYVWNADGVLLGKWPGTKLQYDETKGYWVCEIKADEIPAGTQIIFGNGKSGVEAGNQTEDLEYVVDGIYDRTGLIGMGSSDAVAASVEVSVVGGRLSVTVPVAGDITIVDVTGRMTVRRVEAGTTVIDGLAHGFYIVAGHKVLL